MVVVEEPQHIAQVGAAVEQVDPMVQAGMVLTTQEATLAAVVAGRAEDQMHRFREAQAMEQVVTDLQVQGAVLILEEMAAMVVAEAGVSNQSQAAQVPEGLAAHIPLLHGDPALVLEAEAVAEVAEHQVGYMEAAAVSPGQGRKE